MKSGTEYEDLKARHDAAVLEAMEKGQLLLNATSAGPAAMLAAHEAAEAASKRRDDLARQLDLLSEQGPGA